MTVRDINLQEECMTQLLDTLPYHDMDVDDIDAIEKKMDELNDLLIDITAKYCEI